MPVRVHLTYKDLESLPEDGKRYELHEGEVYVTAAPRVDHQDLVLALASRMSEHARANNLGSVHAGIDIYFSDDTVYIPDILFVSRHNSQRRFRKYIRGAPDLIVEVISPSTEVRDRGLKLQNYARHGVNEYWLFDPGKKTAEVYALKGEAYELAGKYGPTGVLKSAVMAGLELRLETIWPEPFPEE